MKLRSKLSAALWLVIAIGALYGLGYVLIGRSFVPDNFITARRADAEIAKSIVALTEASLENLEAISALDREYKFKDALALVQQELLRAEETRVKAIELASQLDKMTTATEGIVPTRARNLAVEAVGHQISLISHLVVYNDALRGLLQTLELKFLGQIRKDVKDVQTLIENMNTEAREINKLNNLFNEKMQQFDEIVN
jgi:hypothetical protein